MRFLSVGRAIWLNTGPTVGTPLLRQDSLVSDLADWLAARHDEWLRRVAGRYSDFAAEAFLGLPLQERARMANLGMTVSIVDPEQGAETEAIRFGVVATWRDRDDEVWKQARARIPIEAQEQP